MTSQSSLPPEDEWTFADFVERESLQDHSLRQLSRYLTGKYEPNREQVCWPQAWNVNVVICDIYRDPDRIDKFRVNNVDALRHSCQGSDINPKVKIRLFLVEDASIPVIEVIGSSFHCQPHVFEGHMRTVSRLPYAEFDSEGVPGKIKFKYVLPSPFAKVTKSSYRQQAHFSLAFKRDFRYLSDEAQDQHEAVRPMVRRYDHSWENLEERVSGMFCTPANFTCEIGVFLFDSIGTADSQYEEDISPFYLCAERARFTPRKPVPASRKVMSKTSSRGMFLQQLRYPGFQDAVMEDKSILLWSIMYRMVIEWHKKVDIFEYMLRTNQNQTEFANNSTIRSHQDAINSCKEDLYMMKDSLALAEALGPKSIRCKPGTEAGEVMRDVRVDFLDLITRTERCHAALESETTIVAALRSITESEKAIQQADTIGALTGLATVYIPLSFVSSFLGMNVTAISPASTPIWVFFAVAIPLTLSSLVIVRKWKLLLSILEYLIGSAERHDGRSHRRRWFEIFKYPKEVFQEDIKS